MNISGPIVGALVNKFGCRNVAMIGAVISSVSFFVSTFSPNVTVMILLYGFCGGKLQSLFCISLYVCVRACVRVCCCFV